ncbi:MAG: hydrogenase maturation protease [Ignavibacteriae bacterium]|nr:hydrogenase maturation protease [Ignavibacteriota bacterium]
MKVLILGMGNTILNDDAIGIIIVRYLRMHLKNLTGIDFKETSWGGFRIIDLIRGYDYVIIIDSIKTGKSNPGEIHHLKTSDLLPTLRLNSYHDINFITAIKLAEALNEKMPGDIDILAVEVENNFTITEKLTKEIRNSIYECSIRVIDLLKNKNLINSSFNYSELKAIETDEELRSYYDLECIEEFSETENI